LTNPDPEKCQRVTVRELAYRMARNSRPAAYHFGLPPGRVMEIGEQLEI